MQSNCDTPLILDVWSHIEPRFGGIGPAAVALAKAARNRSGWQFEQIAVCNPEESDRSSDIPSSVATVVAHGPRPFSDSGLVRSLKSAIARCNVCHVHGLWLAHSLAARRIANQLGRPIVSSVHGMLERWELANKRLKKAIYSTLFERRSLSRSSCLRALSEQEAADYRNFGMKNPIALVPNGIKAIDRVDISLILSRFPQLIGKQVVLFLGRVHHKKGILNLLEGWRHVIRKHSDAHLLIAGAELEQTGIRVREIIAENKFSQTVTLGGVLNGAVKLSALSLARAFCLPSYSEGLSMAALESLSIGLPVVITKACNVDGVSENGAGYVTSNDPLEVANGVTNVLSLSSSEWSAMSAAATRLARTRYDWSLLGSNMQSVYEWLLGGARPACVIH